MAAIQPFQPAQRRNQIEETQPFSLKKIILLVGSVAALYFAVTMHHQEESPPLKPERLQTLSKPDGFKESLAAIFGERLSVYEKIKISPELKKLYQMLEETPWLFEADPFFNKWLEEDLQSIKQIEKFDSEESIDIAQSRLRKSIKALLSPNQMLRRSLKILEIFFQESAKKEVAFGLIDKEYDAWSVSSMFRKAGSLVLDCVKEHKKHMDRILQSKTKEEFLMQRNESCFKINLDSLLFYIQRVEAIKAEDLFFREKIEMNKLVRRLFFHVGCIYHENIDLEFNSPAYNKKNAGHFLSVMNERVSFVETLKTREAILSFLKTDSFFKQVIPPSVLVALREKSIA